jgi:Ca2+-binding EF-hand superfamily protein
MYSSNIFEEDLENKFRFYDRNKNGFIEQTDFKNVLA